MTADSHLHTVAALGLELLRRRLPAGWTCRAALAEAGGRALIPHEVSLTAPGRRSVRVRLQVARHVVTPQIEREGTSAMGALPPLLLIAPSLDAAARESLTARGINFVDLSGNVRFSLLRPAVSVDVQDAPAPPTARHTRTRLSGSKTARVVRALCDFRTPTDCGRVAVHADVGPAHATRIVRALAREGYVVMTGTHRIESADWAALLRRWSDDRARVSQFRWYVAPRGIASLTSRLQNRHDCVVSGPWAANVFAPVASKQVLLCYVRDEQRFAEQLELAVADTAADVAVSSRFSDAVMEGASAYGEIRVAALSQIAADLLTLSLESTAQPVLEWMRENELAWRR